MAYKTIQLVSVPNLNSSRVMKTDLWAKEVGEVSIKVIPCSTELFVLRNFQTKCPKTALD